ncbi:hypothetical protein [Sulfurivermis fontis]|uniref:hypothetical protein n=1 Tax=Sulfurivermis fontis TaxID=1972068 RepID=UPI00155974E3|nr:hypothetical protein [Sulfurivermis fontis]
MAVRDAFDSLRRQPENLARHERREVKQHETPPHGRITAYGGWRNGEVIRRRVS